MLINNIIILYCNYYMCHKICLFNFHFKVLYLKDDVRKNSAKYHKIFMSEQILRNRLPCTIASAFSPLC